MYMNVEKKFRRDLASSLQMVTINHFEGIFAASGSKATNPSILPPSLQLKTVNTIDYRKRFLRQPTLYWGEHNNFPLEAMLLAMRSSIFEGAMKVLCDHLRGQGLYLYDEVFENGEIIKKPVQDNEMWDELYDIGYFEYWNKASSELPLWGNVWPIYKMNDQRDIRLIDLYDGSWNRLERPDPDSGKIENIYVSAQWKARIDKLFTRDEIPPMLKPWVFKYPLLDTYNYVNEMELKKDTTEFASHHKYHTSGFEYGRAPWHSLYLNDWLKISGKVPEMIIRYYDAAMTINYLIYINQDWLVKKYPDMESWTPEEREEKIKEVQKEFEEGLRGANNSFKSLMLSFRQDSDGQPQKNVMFEPMDNKVREGTFSPDSQLSDAQILYTLTVDPCLMGAATPGVKSSGGSGSNIREASLALQMRLNPDRDLNHTPFYIWRDYKYGKDETRKRRKIGTKDYIINTLDQVAPASAKVTIPK